MRRLLVLACMAVVVAAVIPPPGRAGDGDVVGRTSGAIECKSYQYERSNGSKGATPMMPCDELTWSEDVHDGPTWSFWDRRDFDGRARNGITYSQTVDQRAHFEKTFDAQGDLSGIEVGADLVSTVSHAGDTKTTLELQIPFETTAPTVRLDDTFEVSATGTDNWAARAQGDISVDCSAAPDDASVHEHHRLLVGGRDVTRRNEGDNTFGGSIATGNGQCTLRVKVEIAARNSDIIKSDHSAAVELHLQLALTIPPCDLAGYVRDGVPGHLTDPFHVMTGIPVELLNDQQTVVQRTVSDDRGRYCFRAVPTGAYKMRATLIDGAHDPFIFQTIHEPSSDAVVTEKEVTEGDHSRQDFDIDFAGTAEFPLKHEVAAVHRESTRFVNWLLGAGIITVAEIGTFFINTDVPDDVGTSYSNPGRLVSIQRSDTRFAIRSGPATECPENCEWHEIGHHVGFRLGIPVEGSPACGGRVNHGGWRNETSCDSVIEGFPTFLAALGSLSLDAERSGGYATSQYAHLFDVEGNGFMPWTMYESTRNGQLGREDFAVSQLLWDLVDSTPGEFQPVAISTDAGLKLVRVPDTIQIDGSTLVRFLADTGSATVADIRSQITLGDLLSEAETNRSIDLDGDDVADISAIEAAFLIHGFHALPDHEEPIYHLGDPIGSTRRQAVNPSTGLPLPDAAVVDRDKMYAAKSSAIRLENASASDVTFTVEITYPASTQQWDVIVPANGSELMGLELPPHAASIRSDRELPPCDVEDHRLVTVSISAPGIEPMTFDNCAYAHAIADATGEHAMVYGVGATGSGEPRASAGPGASPASVDTGGTGQPPIVLLALVVGAIVVVVVAVIVLRRRVRTV